MTTAEITTRVLALAQRRFGLAEGTLQAEQDLFSSLGIDSVQALELLSDVEQEFQVEIPDYELLDVRSFADLAARIAERA